MTCIIICFKPRNLEESGKRKLEATPSEGAEENGNSDSKKTKRD